MGVFYQFDWLDLQVFHSEFELPLRLLYNLYDGRLDPVRAIAVNGALLAPPSGQRQSQDPTMGSDLDLVDSVHGDPSHLGRGMVS